MTINKAVFGLGLDVAYADPPYVGQAKRHYDDDEVDHAELVARLMADYPDGWALSCSGQSLQALLRLCPDGVRVGSWAKPWSNMLPGIRVQYCWEPVIFCGGRQGKHIKGDALLRDYVVANPDGFTFRKINPGAVIGRKPRHFCWWMFDVLGLGPQDSLHDLFPGNGAVAQAWQEWLAAGCPRIRQTVKPEEELLARASSM